MPINEVNKPEDNKQAEQKPNEPLLNINLPAPANGDPRTPLTIGQHNAAAQHNFKKVADIVMAVINNQRMVASVIDEQQKAIKELQAANKALAENLRKLLGENYEEPSTDTSKS